jgi:hypothetical protein
MGKGRMTANSYSPSDKQLLHAHCILRLGAVKNKAAQQIKTNSTLIIFQLKAETALVYNVIFHGFASFWI